MSEELRSVLPSGVDLMRRINEGSIQTLPAQQIEEARREIVSNIEELVEVGARIRPLVSDRVQHGWVRGVHWSERKKLQRWCFKPNDFIFNILRIATSLTPEEINHLTGNEMRALAEIISKMGEYDMSLYPYLPAYATTSSSERLWHGVGTALSGFENRVVELPDGKSIKILVPSDHARMWASLCVYREQAKKRLDEQFNALLTIRPTAGKSADPLDAELKSTARTMRVDAEEPWQKVLRVETPVDINDGWAHADNSPDGMYREMLNMLANDKHEQFMTKFYQQIEEQATEQQEELGRKVAERGGPGIYEETMEILTEEEVNRRARELRKGRVAPPPVNLDQQEVTGDPRLRFKKYTQIT